MSLLLVNSIPLRALQTERVEGRGEYSLEELVVEMAESPQQHAALADYYRSKTEAARAEGQRHERMGKSYRRGKITTRDAMARHCQKIADQQHSFAEEYDALAKLHEKEARAKR